MGTKLPEITLNEDNKTRPLKCSKKRKKKKKLQRNAAWLETIFKNFYDRKTVLGKICSMQVYTEKKGLKK